MPIIPDKNTKSKRIIATKSLIEELQNFRNFITLAVDEIEKKIIEIMNTQQYGAK